MGALAGMVGNAVDAYSGKSSGTTLQSFLDKFSNSRGRYVETLDPLGTFDVRFKFYPTTGAGDKMKGWAAVEQSLVNSAAGMGQSLLDSATGGIFSSLYEGGKKSVMDAHDSFENAGRHSFMEYLAPANLLQGGEQWSSPKQANSPLELELGLYVQKITVPQLKTAGDSKSETCLGEFPVPGSTVVPDGNLVMSVVNTKAALHERIFYPWLRETTLPYWSYEQQPYTTATVTLDFTKHSDTRYVFTGVRPIQIKTLEATQAADFGNLEREITFAFDFMFVTSDLNVNDSLSDRLLGSAGALASGAAKMLNL